MSLKCDICGFIAKNPQGLAGHKRLKHEIPCKQATGTEEHKSYVKTKAPDVEDLIHKREQEVREECEQKLTKKCEELEERYETEIQEITEKYNQELSKRDGEVNIKLREMVGKVTRLEEERHHCSEVSREDDRKRTFVSGLPLPPLPQPTDIINSFTDILENGQTIFKDLDNPNSKINKILQKPL